MSAESAGYIRPIRDGVDTIENSIDTFKVLDQVEALVDNSKRFMGFVKLDEDQFFQLMSKLRASLPEDVRRAGKITRNTDKIMEAAQSEAGLHVENAKGRADQIVAEARAEAERLIAEAKAHSDALVSQSEVQRIASAQAREIVAQAEQEANEIRSGADEYAHSILSTLETQVSDVMGQVQGRVDNVLATIRRGRMKLEQTAASASAVRRVAPFAPSDADGHAEPVVGVATRTGG